MKQQYANLLIVLGIFSTALLQSQNCPPSGFTNGNSLFFFYDSGSSDCIARPSTVKVGVSEFTLDECEELFSVYKLSTGSPLPNFSPFTPDFGFGTCEYRDGHLSSEIQSVSRVNYYLKHTTLYPNPVTNGNELQLKSSAQLSGNLSIYSVTGKLMKSKLISNFDTESIDISGISNGVYIVKIESNSASVTKKLVINK